MHSLSCTRGSSRPGHQVRQPPPLLTGDRPHCFARGMAQKIVGILDPDRSPDRTRIERRPQLTATKAQTLLREFDRPVNQAAVEILGGPALAESDRGTLTGRRASVPGGRVVGWYRAS